jgi:hypothetical protein
MFLPVVAIIRFNHSTNLRLFYTIRVAACLMRRSQRENPDSSNKESDVEISLSYTPPRKLHRIILSRMIKPHDSHYQPKHVVLLIQECNI